MSTASTHSDTINTLQFAYYLPINGNKLRRRRKREKKGELFVYDYPLSYC